ncbi:MAG TPA: glutaredoxin family protein [Pyrinomonadaceae bacterium]|nr:glutaredoxin family protein [Pyrinomonadaceae bacterium]
MTIYTRPGCHLCDEAKREMERARCADLYTLEEVNVDDDAELARRYGYDIPVVVMGGRVAFKHRLTAADFARELRLLSD